jgi:hypothetical protein
MSKRIKPQSSEQAEPREFGEVTLHSLCAGSYVFKLRQACQMTLTEWTVNFTPGELAHLSAKGTIEVIAPSEDFTMIPNTPPKPKR